MAGGTGQSQTPMGGGESPLNTGGGMSGGQTQTPNFAAPQQQPMQQPTQQSQSIPSVLTPLTPEQFKPYRWPPMTREEEHQNALAKGYYGRREKPATAQPQYQQPFGGFYGQQPQPMQNPFQPQQPSYMQDPEFQGYQTQVQDLNRQMNEYMQKAPMYQQLQDLQGKMSGYQQRYQQQELQRMQQMQQYQQPSPFRRGQFQQPAGIQGLMGMLGGRSSGRDIGSYEQYMDRNNRALASPTQEVKQPTMSRADFETHQQQLMSRLQPRMSMDMPYARGFASELPTYFMKKGGKV